MAVPIVIKVDIDSACKLDKFKRFPKHYKHVLRGDPETWFTWTTEAPLEIWIPQERYQRFQVLAEKIPRILQGTEPLCGYIAQEKKEGVRHITNTCGRACRVDSLMNQGGMLDDGSWVCQPCAYWQFHFEPFPFS